MTRLSDEDLVALDDLDQRIPDADDIPMIRRLVNEARESRARIAELESDKNLSRVFANWKARVAELEAENAELRADLAKAINDCTDTWAIDLCPLCVSSPPYASHAPDCLVLKYAQPEGVKQCCCEAALAADGPDPMCPVHGCAK